MWSQLKGATYTDPHTKKIIAYSEIERREDVFDCLYCQLERKHAFVSLYKIVFKIAQLIGPVLLIWSTGLRRSL